MTRKPLLQRLDDSVRWTGIPALTASPPRRRPMRWPATIALALAFSGYGLSLAHAMQGGAAIIGNVMEIVGFSIGSLVQIVGPLKPLNGIEPVDEWDRAIRTRAYLFTFTIFAVVTVVSLALIAAGLAFQYPTAALMQGTTQTLFLLLAILLILPTAHASWAVRWQDDGHTG